MEPIDLPDSSLKCPNCNNTITVADRFCGSCGSDMKVEVLEHHEDVFTTLKPTLIFYFATLLLLATYKLTSIFPEGIEGLIIVSCVDVLLVLIFWAYHYKELKPLLSLSDLSLKFLLYTIVGALLGAVAVHLVASVINVSIYEDVYYSPYLFQDTNNPFAWAVILTCIQPAIFEEVAFRGFLFSNLEKITTAKSAVYITGFLFGIIHLSFISLLWLVPIGLIFAMMRIKYNSLWYGIVGHFTYNLCITAIEFWF